MMFQGIQQWERVVFFDEKTPLLPAQNDEKITVINDENFFDKYVVDNSDELEALQKQGVLKGGLVFTSDSKHVGIHKGFYAAHVIKKNCEKICQGRKKARKIDLNICHAMIVVGWNDEKRRPILAHSVMDGVKINSVDYFKPIKYCGRPYKTADRLIVYIPRDQKLREEFSQNALLSGKISSEKKNRSPFSYGKMIASIFKRQIHKTPLKTMREDVAYAVTDILMRRKFSPASKSKKTRTFFCTELAVCLLQASILTNALSKEQKEELCNKHESRNQLAQEIYRLIGDSSQGKHDLSKAYWESRICSQINSKSAISAYVSFLFDKFSTVKELDYL